MINCKFCNTNLTKTGEGNYCDLCDDPHSYYYHCVPCGTKYITNVEYKRVEVSPSDWHWTDEVISEKLTYIEMKKGKYRAEFWFYPNPSCRVWLDYAKGRTKEIGTYRYHPHFTPQNLAMRAKTMQVFS